LHLDLIKPGACLISRRSLHALILFPLPNALRGSAARPLLSFARGGISSKLRVGWRRRPTGDLRHARVRVVLIRRPREPATGRRRRIVDDRPDFGSDFRARTKLAIEALHWSVASGWLDAVWRRATTLTEQQRRTLTRKLLLRRTLRCSESRMLWWQICWSWLVRSRLLVLGRRREAAMSWRQRTLGFLIRPKCVLARRAGSTRCHWRLWLLHAISVIILVEGWWRCWRVL
jgi:hypothetical protein